MGENSLILQISEARDIIKNMLLKKNLHEVDILYAKCYAQKLINYTNGNDAGAYVLLGKINYLSKNVDEAKENFNSAIELNSLLASPYYGLFKIYIDQEKYDKALHNIKLYGKYSGINVDIYINLLNICLGNNCFEIKKQNNILGQHKIDEQVLTSYNNIIIGINNCDYSFALDNIKKCIVLISKYNYHIDLSFLFCLLQKVNSMQIELNNKKNISELTEEFLKCDNWGIGYLYLKKLAKLEPNNINIWIFLIEISILYVDYKGARKYLDAAKEVIGAPNQRIEYLEKKINKLNKESREYIDDLKINSFANKGRIKKAVDLCKECYKDKNDVDYLFLAGKILYESNYINIAFLYFDKYKELGCAYLKETYYYLFYICNMKQQNDKASYYAKLIYDLSMYEGVNVSIESFESMLLFYTSNFKSECILELEKNLLNPLFTENNINGYQKVMRLDA